MSNEHVTVLYHFWLLLIAKSRAGRLCSPFLLSVRTKILLRREQDWGKINDMPYISLLKVCFHKALCVCLEFVCASKCIAMSVSLYPPSTDKALSLSSMCFWLQPHIPLSLSLSVSPPLSPIDCQGITSLCDCSRRCGSPIKPQRAAYDEDSQSATIRASLCLSEETPLLTDCSVISWPLDPPGSRRHATSSSGWDDMLSVSRTACQQTRRGDQ